MIWYETQTSATIPKSLNIVFHRKPASQIGSWSGWPDDVKVVLIRLNQQRPYRLRFTRTLRQGGFTCTRCLAHCAPNISGDADLDGHLYCDDCMIAMVRGGEIA